MPELPDITIYLEHFDRLIVGKKLVRVRLTSPFLLRTVEPSIADVEGKCVVAVHRIGKRMVWETEEELFLVFHLMIAGRFHRKASGSKTGGKNVLAVFEFESDLFQLTEASTRKRASLHLVRGRDSLIQFDRGGLEVLDASLEEFGRALTRENHTLKRTLTDPRLFSAIGNAYSDEILHRARLSPLKPSQKLSVEEISQLHRATIDVLKEWIERLRRQSGTTFPETVTAFHEEMAVHGKFGSPCPVCGAIIQRIVYVENECNYCPRCQTGGTILADRSLSRLLKGDWPRTIDELEASTHNVH